jgi:glutamyl/glutaminyl-tRNA synthetase
MDRSSLEAVIDLFKGRMATLQDFLDWADFVFVERLHISEENRQKFFSEEIKKYFQMLSERLEKVDDFTAQSAEKVFRQLVDELKQTASTLVHPVRVALTGKTVGPGLFETMAILGKEKTIQRLRHVFC